MIELFDKNILKILTAFSISPGYRHNRKKIKEKTSIPNIVLDKTLNKLVNYKILEKNKNLFSLNFKNTDIKELIKPFSENYSKLKQLQLKEYFMIIRIQDELSQFENVNDVYLFGSYSKLVFNPRSDIDIAIISDNVNEKEVQYRIIKLEEKFKKSIQLHFFPKTFYKNKKDPLVKEILQHGIKLI